MRHNINKNTLILEIMDKYPKIGEILVTKYGLHCIGCGMAQMETIEDGALAHGMSATEIKEMLEDLNTKISKANLSKKKK